MTTTVRQLIEYLEKLPSDLPVQVRDEYYCGTGMGYSMEWVDLELPKSSEDWTETCFIYSDSLGLGGN